MKKLTFDDICKYLEDNDFECISMHKGNKRIYVTDNDRLIVHVEENIPNNELTSEDEERIKKRMKELGYMI